MLRPHHFYLLYHPPWKMVWSHHYYLPFIHFPPFGCLDGDKMKEKIVDFSWENTQQSYTTTMHTTTAQQENSLYSPSPQHLNPLLLDPPLLQNFDPPPLLILDPPLTLWKLLECQVSGRLDPDHLNVWNLVHLNVCSCGLGHKRVCCHC